MCDVESQANRLIAPDETRIVYSVTNRVYTSCIEVFVFTLMLHACT